MVKVIIAGSRNFYNYDTVEETVISYFMSHGFPKENIEIISGGARGADSLGEQLAKSYELKLTIFSAQWDTYGKAAGMIRNKEMADYAIKDSNKAILFAFWDGQSRGTKGMIDIAKRCSMEVIINGRCFEKGF